MIKRLNEQTLKEAVNLKVRSWEEEVHGRFFYPLDEQKEYAFFSAWMKEEDLHQDKRVLLGYFENEQLLGAVFTSYAEKDIKEEAVEINGLWVEECARGKAIGLRLLKEALSKYDHEKYVVVYNHHYAPSNTYYQMLGGQVFLKEKQLEGQMDVDVFLFDYDDLLAKVNAILERKNVDEETSKETI